MDETLVASLEPTPDEVRQELRRILSSNTFATAKRQRSFLRYVVEQTLKGEGSHIKEYSVGTDVFDKDESFDPRLDNIVRAEARKLRARLAKYYETEGLHSTVHIDLGKGSYAPSFRVAGVAPQEPLPHAAEPALVADTLPTPSASGPLKQQWWRTTGTAVVTLALLAVAAIGAYLFFTAPRAGLRTERASIAVLPFANLSEGKDGEVFSDGLTQELVDSLARLPGLRVVARTSTSQYKGQTVDVRAIGRQLGAGTLLEGSVRRYGDRLRITAQLDDASTGYHVWSQSYDRELTDALTIQREISEAIATALALNLVRGNGVRDPVSPEAHEAYLKGLYFWNKNSAEDIARAMAYFQESIAKDPDYARAHVGLANALVGLPIYTPMPARDLVPRIRAAASKASELDPALAGAHLALAWAYQYEFSWREAEKEFRRAIELDPSDAFARRWYGGLLIRLNRLEEAYAENKTAMELDPVSPFIGFTLPRVLYHSRRFDEAIDLYRKAVALEPSYGATHRGLSLALAQKGMHDQAIAEAEAAYSRMGLDPYSVGALGYVYATSGNSTKARDVLAVELAQGRRVRPFAVAMIHLGLKDWGEAFEWLGHAVDASDMNVFLKTDPIYDPIRQDRRFNDLLRRMKLD